MPYDVAVVGLGAVGSSALYALARQGVRVVGIDRFNPPHAFGSSHGETRITRQAIGEGEAYVPLVLRSNAILESIEAQTGEVLIERCGFLLIMREDENSSCHGKAGFLATTISAARGFGITHEVLGSVEVAQRFPQFTGLVGDEQAYYEPGGGLVRPERCVAALLQQARSAGAHIRTDSQVSAIVNINGDFRISSPSGDVIANHVILATGAWVGQLAPKSVNPHIRIYRQALHWFALLDSSAYRAGCTPTFYWGHGLTTAEQFYGFPPVNGQIKAGLEQYATEWDPDDLSRDVAAQEGYVMAQKHVTGRLAGVARLPSHSKACLYTATSDFDFLIDFESHPRYVVVSACSGHGFKHAPALGEAVAARVLGLKSSFDTGPFEGARFRNASSEAPALNKLRG